MYLNKLCILCFCVLLCVSAVAMSHLGRGHLVIGGHASIHNPAQWGRGYSRLWTAAGHLGQSSSCGAPCHSSRSSSITRPGSAPIWPYLRHQQSVARMRSSTSPPAVVDQPPVPLGVPHHAAVPRPRERGVLVVVIPAHRAPVWLRANAVND